MTNTPTVLTEAQIGEIEARDAYYLGEVTCDTPKYVHDSPYLLLDRRALLRHIRSTPVASEVASALRALEELTNSSTWSLAYETADIVRNVLLASRPPAVAPQARKDGV